MLKSSQKGSPELTSLRGGIAGRIIPLSGQFSMNQSANLESDQAEGSHERRANQGEQLAPTEPAAANRPRFLAGNRVRVYCGVFAGVEGSVIALCGANRLVIAVDLQQKGISLEIDDAAIELAE